MVLDTAKGSGNHLKYQRQQKQQLKKNRAANKNVQKFQKAEITKRVYKAGKIKLEDLKKYKYVPLNWVPTLICT